MRRRHPIVKVAALILGDTLCIALAYVLAGLAVAFAAGDSPFAALPRHEHALYVGFFLVAWYATASHQRLYARRRSDGLLPQLFAVAKAAVAAFMLSVFVLVLVNEGHIARYLVFLFGALSIILLVFFRLAARLSLWGLHLRGMDRYNVLLVGANDATIHVIESIQAHEQFGYHITGLLDDSPERAKVIGQYGVPYLGKLDTLESALLDHVVDGVYICLPVRSFYGTVLSVTHLCEGIGVPVRLVADRLPLGAAVNYMWRLEDVPLMTLSEGHALQARSLTRRAFDWIVSTLLLLILAPVYLAIFLLIKADSHGPAFVREPRKGWRGREFSLLTFRCTQHRPGNAPMIGQQALTRVGRHLRRYNLDQLPQLLNVWNGEIGITGPVHAALVSKRVAAEARARRDAGVRFAE
ncbi:MAG: hypothetical protein GWP08_13580 [Nitrospiraceae bacterium]|nr:hypothetical protein [Nitrospiraceae bacterium]